MLRLIKPLFIGGILTVLLILLNACTAEYNSTQETGYKDPARDFTLGKFNDPNPLKTHTGTVTYSGTHGNLGTSKAFISAFTINSANYVCIMVDEKSPDPRFQMKLCFTVATMPTLLSSLANYNVCSNNPSIKIISGTNVYTTTTCTGDITFGVYAGDTSDVTITGSTFAATVNSAPFSIGTFTRLPRYPY